MNKIIFTFLFAAIIPCLLLATENSAGYLVEVNGARLSVSNAMSEVSLRVRLFKKTGSNQESITKYEDLLRKSITQNFIRKEGLRSYAEEHRLTLSPMAFTDRCEKVARHFGYKSYVEMRNEFSAAEQEIFEKSTRLELVAEMAEAHLRADIDDKVTEAEIDAAYEQLEVINATANATNRQVWAKATNIYERIHAGKLDFKDAVKQYSEGSGKSLGGYWRCMKRGEMADDEPILFSVFSEKPRQIGDLLPPVEADSGVMICKVTGKMEDRWELSGIQMRLAVVWQHPEREQLRKTLESNKRSDALKAKYQKIAAGQRVVYPSNPPVVDRVAQPPMRTPRPVGAGWSQILKGKQ